ncbi:MAG: single-stranded-DNA-specific exonuclease RecJ [Vicinamibacterales bacterium]
MPAPLIWETGACDESAATSLALELGVSRVVARLLVQRGLDDPDAAARFLAPSLSHLHDPLMMADLGVAADRLLAAIERREPIAIHGDYDVDGITGTVILRRMLEMLGANVVHFIPDRIRDGYGLKAAAIERLHAEGIRLIVSVDCGIRAHDAAACARSLGVDLIVTDHHEPDALVPPAVAVLDPRRSGCSYPEKHLSGAGVVLKLVQELCRRAGHEEWLPAFVKIAAIGTLADVVPLTGENRVIAKIGLELLSRGPHKVGLRALLDVAGLSGRRIEAHEVAFQLAPRVNAAGRMSTAEIAMRLLLASDEAMAGEARDLAETLDAENSRRQREERDIVDAARRVIDTDPDVGARSVLVVAGEGWHRGVVGIVASKLVESYYRPVVVLSVDGDVAHGSCRSIAAFDMLAALERCQEHLATFGGHRLAAGLSLETARIKAFRNALCELADDVLEPDDLRPRLRIDARLGFRGIDQALVDALDRMAPFGAGNPRPIFQATRVEIADGPRRVKDRHLKMALRHQGRVFRAMAWRAVEREAFLLANKTAVDVAFSLDRNTYNGETFLEMTVADVRAASAEEAG